MLMFKPTIFVVPAPQSDVESYKPTSSPSASSSKSTPASSSSKPAQASSSSSSADYEDVPASSMRKIIGQRLLESKTTVPHYYVTVEVNMGEFNVFESASLRTRKGEGLIWCMLRMTYADRPSDEVEGNVQQGFRGQEQALGQRLQ